MYILDSCVIIQQLLPLLLPTEIVQPKLLIGPCGLAPCPAGHYANRHIPAPSPPSSGCYCDGYTQNCSTNTCKANGYGSAPKPTPRPTPKPVSKPKPRPKPRPSPSKPKPKPKPRPSSSEVRKWEQNEKAIKMKINDIPSECYLHKFDVAINSVALRGSHFFLSATASDKKTLDLNDKCPNTLLFASIDGKKVMYHVPKDESFDDFFYTHRLGTATLKDIIDAEQKVKAVDDSDYDLTKNSCVHYAGSVWRELQFDETPELADFLIENLLRDDGLIDIAHQKVAMGGLRVLSKYLIDEDSFENYVKETVVSQLVIQE